MTGPIGTGKTTLFTRPCRSSRKSCDRASNFFAFILNPTLSPRIPGMISRNLKFPARRPSKQRVSRTPTDASGNPEKGRHIAPARGRSSPPDSRTSGRDSPAEQCDTYQESFSRSFCAASRNSWASWASQNCALRQRVASTCSLRPLSFPEVRAYIAERLQSAGFRGATSCFRLRSRAIFRLTEGFPVDQLLSMLSGTRCRAHRTGYRSEHLGGCCH